MLVYVYLGKPEVDHVDRFLVWRNADDTVSQLDITMENPSVMHELQPGDLQVTEVNCAVFGFGIQQLTIC